MVQSFIYSTFIILCSPYKSRLHGLVFVCYLDWLLSVWTLSCRHIPSGLNPLHSYAWHANSQANCPWRKINLENWLNSYRPVWKSLRDQRGVCLRVLLCLWVYMAIYWKASNSCIDNLFPISHFYLHVLSPCT